MPQNDLRQESVLVYVCVCIQSYTPKALDALRKAWCDGVITTSQTSSVTHRSPLCRCLTNTRLV